MAHACRGCHNFADVLMDAAAKWQFRLATFGLLVKNDLTAEDDSSVVSSSPLLFTTGPTLALVFTIFPVFTFVPTPSRAQQQAEPVRILRAF